MGHLAHEHLGEPAVDRYELASNEGSGIRDEEGNGSADVLGLPYVAKRDESAPLLRQLRVRPDGRGQP